MKWVIKKCEWIECDCMFAWLHFHAFLLDGIANNSSVCINLQQEYNVLNYSLVFNGLWSQKLFYYIGLLE